MHNYYNLSLDLPVKYQLLPYFHGASPMAQTVKNQRAIQKTWVRSLGQEDPLEKRMTSHSGILAWKITWTEEPDRLHSKGSQRVRHSYPILYYTILYYTILYYTTLYYTILYYTILYYMYFQELPLF